MGTIDGTSWSDVTIDGEPVQEITVDGDVVWENTVAYSNLVAWYKFNTSSTEDSSSNNNDGTISGSPNYISTAGPLNNGAYDFDGTDDYINIPNSPSISLTNEITECAWVYSENHQDRGTIATKNASYYFQINTDGGVETYTYYGTNRSTSDYFDSTNNISENSWNHVAWTEDTDGLRTIYINGKLDSTSQHEATIYDSSDPLRIGAQSSSNRQFNGKIRDVRIYNRALSSSEISEIYDKTKPDTYKFSNLLIWLPFDDGTASDKSGNGFDGSVSGASYLSSGGPSGRGAYSFDGSGDRIDLGNPSVDLSQSISISFWANPDTNFTSRRNPIDKAYGGEFSFTFEDDSDSDQFSTYFGSAGSNSNPYRSTPFQNSVFPNTWTHYVWTRDNSSQTVELYINGTRSTNKDSSDAWETPSQSNDSLLIGDGYTNSFRGDITDVRIYDTVLNESDANTIYNNTK